VLPIGVLLQKAFANPGSRNKLLGTAIAMVLLIGAFATGLSINIQFGDVGDDGRPFALQSAIDPDTGEEVLLDENGEVVDPADVGDLEIAAGSGPGGGSSGGGGGSGPADTGPAEVAGQTATAPVEGGNPCEGAQLGATDQGVTDKTIKLGVLVPNLNELNAAGFDVGLSGDFDAIMNAWTNEFNRTGGVACRKVTWVKDVFDVTSTDDMLRACRVMTQDQKVFSVVTPGGYDSVGQLCIAKDAKVPLINPEPEPASWYRDAAPYLWTLSTSKDRGHINHVKYLVEHGHLTKKHKIGVIYDGVPHVAPATEAGLLPELKRQGMTPTKKFKLAADVEQALGQINQVVVDFQLAGVDFVFMPMNLIYKTQFMTSAEQQGYYPQYTDSDHNFGCFDFTTSTYPARSYEDTICVTSSDAYGRVDLVKYADQHPYGKYGDQVYLKTHKAGYGPDKEADSYQAQRALHLSLGSSLRAWQMAANRVGPDITRAKWGASMGQTGNFDQCICEKPLHFAEGKWDATTQVKGLIWKSRAGNGYRERWFRELTRPQEAYVQTFVP
jgi:hypothetical protein